jgi:hypothetical protein
VRNSNFLWVAWQTSADVCRQSRPTVGRSGSDPTRPWVGLGTSRPDQTVPKIAPDWSMSNTALLFRRCHKGGRRETGVPRPRRPDLPPLLASPPLVLSAPGVPTLTFHSSVPHSPVRTAVRTGRTAKIQSSPAVWTDCVNVVRPVHGFRGLQSTAVGLQSDVHLAALITEEKKHFRVLKYASHYAMIVH